MQAAANDSCTTAGIQVVIEASRGHINLRGNAEDGHLVAAAEKSLGQDLPRAPNTFTQGKHRIYWLGPDEWLIVTAAASAGQQSAHLAAALREHHAAVNDLSGGQIALRLSGEGVERLLAKGCSLDLHPDVFPIGACAQSGLAKAQALFACIDDKPTFQIIVRRSFSDYLMHWLQHAALSGGVRLMVD